MSETKHTPGPWNVFYREGDKYPGIEAGILSIVVYSHIEGDCGVQGSTLEESLANAQLIAAAPELLEACESVMDAIAGHTDWHPDHEVDDDSWNEDAHIEITLTVADCRMLKRALAKVKGGKP